jgi:hypothetical protein
MTSLAQSSRKIKVDDALLSDGLGGIEETSKKRKLDGTERSESSEQLDKFVIAESSSEDFEAAVTLILMPENRILKPHHIRELEEQGYTIIENVISDAACDDRRARLMDEMEARGVHWKNPNVVRSAGPQIHGIIQHLEIGHSAPVWETRQEPLVGQVFNELFNDNDQLVSFDGACIWRESDFDRGGKWWHVDQAFSRTGRRCIQGSVTLGACESGGLLVLPKGHQQHANFAKFAKKPKNKTDDWYKFTDAEFARLKTMAGTEEILVRAPKRSLVLWDSRLPHMTMMGHKNAPPHTRTRCVVYVCMQPRALASQATIAERINAFKRHDMSTHWPASTFKLFPRRWNKMWCKTRGIHDPTPEQRTRVETPRMLELAGVTPLTTMKAYKFAPALEFVN